MLKITEKNRTNQKIMFNKWSNIKCKTNVDWVHLDEVIYNFDDLKIKIINF